VVVLLVTLSSEVHFERWANPYILPPYGGLLVQESEVLLVLLLYYFQA